MVFYLHWDFFAKKGMGIIVNKIVDGGKSASGNQKKFLFAPTWPKSKILGTFWLWSETLHFNVLYSAFHPKQIQSFSIFWMWWDEIDSTYTTLIAKGADKKSEFVVSLPLTRKVPGGVPIRCAVASRALIDPANL